MKIFSIKKFLAFPPLMLLLSANATETYLCVAKIATGFKADKEYRAVNFKSENKWVIKKLSETDWTINKFGEDSLYFYGNYCLVPQLNSKNVRPMLMCNNAFERIDFNPLAKKYQYYRIGGYAHSFFEGDDVVLEIGTCHKI